MLQKAFELYEGGKVTQVKEGVRSYRGIVIGTQPYNVSVEARRYDYADCTCYLGKNDEFCKHMVALAIYVVKNGEPLTDEDKKIYHSPTCSGKIGELGTDELREIKKTISYGMRYIKPYHGLSRLWFSYQNSLAEGCNRLAKVVSELPVSKQAADLLVSVMLRLDKKLTNGRVDDSDGVVGGCIEELVEVTFEYVKIEPKCLKAVEKLRNQNTCFGWEEPLVGLLERKNNSYT
ncbi:hypothetical protein KC721_03225 [Candidatus Woesebacteria bacterium]|nr:hypothetical protein [Candidatus Woesebacteria bacterium]